LKKYGVRRFPFAFAVFVLTAGSFGILLTRNLVETFLCAELISISLFYIFFTATIPIIFPQKKNPEAIFIGGAGKPPYISANELFSPQLSLIPGRTTKNELPVRKHEHDTKGATG
jgi:hypothetical protein